MRVLTCLLAAGLASARLVRPTDTRGAEARIELDVDAASSLRDVLPALAPALEAATRTRLVFNFGASNDLEHQIEAAGWADLFLAADEISMDRLERAGLVDAGSRRILLSNRLVVVGPADSPLRINSPSDLAGNAIRRLSIAAPDAVPAGRYARAWLEKSGVWAGVSHRIVPAIDVRAALAVVESGAAEAGIVYKTDAAISRKIRILYEVPDGEGPAIAYSAAAIAGRPRLEAARRALDWLSGAEAAAAFERFGFIAVTPKRKPPAPARPPQGGRL